MVCALFGLIMVRGLVAGLFGWFGLVWLTGLFTKCDGFGVWLGDCCWLRDTGLNKVRCRWVVAEFSLGAMQTGYSWVMWLVMDYRVCIRCEAVGV